MKKAKVTGREEKLPTEAKLTLIGVWTGVFVTGMVVGANGVTELIPSSLVRAFFLLVLGIGMAIIGLRALLKVPKL